MWYVDEDALIDAIVRLLMSDGSSNAETSNIKLQKLRDQVSFEF